MAHHYVCVMHVEEEWPPLQLLRSSRLTAALSQAPHQLERSFRFICAAQWYVWRASHTNSLNTTLAISLRAHD
jgi:hypothetical protein